MLLEEKNKKPYLSKTLIANLIVAGVAMFGPELVEKLPKEQIMMALAGINMVLRLVTKDKLGLS